MRNLANIFFYILIALLMAMQYIWHLIIIGSFSTHMTIAELIVFIFISLIICFSILLKYIFPKNTFTNLIMTYLLIAEESILSILWIISILDSFKYKNEIFVLIAGFAGFLSVFISFLCEANFLLKFTPKK